MSEHDEGLVERVAMAIDPVAWLHGEVQGHLLNQARAAIRALAPELRHDPPEGCEWVALPTEVVDRYGNRDYEGPIAHACRDAQARRPKPEPRTEWVPVWDAVKQGRMAVTPDGKGFDLGRGDVLIYPTSDGGRIMGDDAGHPKENRPVVSPDGKVEVLAEDDQ